jgi:hypothetical protein
MTRAAVALALLAAHAAAADPAHVDWARGLVIAEGLGVADRQAPSPAVALGTSKRAGAARARLALTTAVKALPMASGGTVGEQMTDATVAAHVTHAIEQALEIAAEPETDGSWHVTLAVPIESVRQAIAGARALPSNGDSGVAVVIIDGAGAATPAVGWSVGGAAGAVLWVSELPAWAKTAPHVRAKAAARGRIDAALPAGAGTATVYVVTR